MRPNKNIKIILNYILGPVVFVLLAWSIYHQIHRQPNWRESLYQVQHLFDRASVGSLGIVVLLMFFNWGLEARKWQVAVRSVQSLSFAQAFRATFSGTTLAFFTPNRMGEYAGRILYIRKGKRIQGISLTIVCSMAQLLVTLVAGCAGLLAIRRPVAAYFREADTVLFWLDIVLYVALAGLVILTLLYFRLSWLIRGIEKIPALEKYKAYIRVLDNFNATTLFHILSLSVCRYLVFMLQYYLLFRLFKVELEWWQVFWSMSAVFLMIAIIPSIAALTELGIRWQASIQLVQLFSTNVVGILATSLAAWLINLVIPALIGSLLILGIRLYRDP